MMAEKTFSSERICEHCNNRAPMEIIYTYAPAYTVDLGRGVQVSEGPIYELLQCPACSGIILRQHFWNEYMEVSDITFNTLYPSASKIPIGLPDSIHKAYEAAIRVRSIDTNAYAVLIGRTLEMVCKDRNASGKNLYKKLKDLATKGEIPQKLVGVAHGLRGLRNVGAHAELGELSSAEIPILDDLLMAILQYVYSAPHLAQQAEERIKQLRTSQDNS